MRFKRLSKRKIKNSALACLSVTMCVTLSAGAALANFSGGSFVGANSSDSLSFTEVTDEYDTSYLTAQNFNSSVLSGVKASYETRTVIVSLEGDSLLDAMGESESVSDFGETPAGFALQREIDVKQKKFLNKLKSKNIKYTLKSSYSAIANAVAIEIDTSYVLEIKAMDGVKSAVIGKTYLVPQTVDAASATVYANGNGAGAPTDDNGAVMNDSFVNPTGIYKTTEFQNEAWGTGAGTVVAVIDTGLDYTHNAFQKFMNTPQTLAFSQSYIASKLQSTKAMQRTTLNGGTLGLDNVYVSDKVPFAFDYADNDADVYPSYSNHGTHVAGIIGGYDPTGYDDKDGNHIDETFSGVAPDAQLVICKAFTDNLDDPALGGAEAENILDALEDCVTLGVDVINMSLGSTAGFTTTDDGDDEGELYNDLFNRIQSSGISIICAASNDYSAGFGSTFGTNLASNPDSATVGSPSTYYAALSVASVSGQKSEYMQDSQKNAIFFENASNGNAVQYDFIKQMLESGYGTVTENGTEFEYVSVGRGQSSNYYGQIRTEVRGKIALAQRGGNTFQQKVELAQQNGAIGIIVYNNVPGTIRMSLGDVAEDKFVPAVSITMDAGKLLSDNAELRNGVRVGKITLNRSLSAGPFMSPFSSWGPTPDLKIKPEITAHGGEITSTVPGGYAEQSGTSMAAPNMAGLTALVRNYVKTLPYINDNTSLDASAKAQLTTQLTNQLILSTATTAYDEQELAYSPRKQGSGLANLKNIVTTDAFIYTDQDSDGKYYYKEKDGRPKMELGDDDLKTGKYEFSFKVRNLGGAALNFTPQALVMTETIASDGIAVAEKAHMLSGTQTARFKVNGASVDKVTVPENNEVTVTVSFELSSEDRKYLEDNFKNGMYVEGFIKLLSDENQTNSHSVTQCDLTLPFLGFYGDWESAPMLDMDAYELARLEQNTAIDDENKPSATVWATQPYASYWNEDFIIPLGSYVYTQNEAEDPMYAEMEHNALSRYNLYYSDDGIGNYMTTYNIRCVYAGLLRNARRVNYKLYDVSTGELIREDHVDRISKAYANGGSARPAYVELKLSADDLGLLANGKYRFDFEFLFDGKSEVKEENTFSFEFYVDYESPVLQDARLRYYNYKDGTKDKQRIYLDLDVFDNHYAQSIMLTYRDTSVTDETRLVLATDYITPVRNANKNGTTTVSIEVTDIWDEYKDNLYVQIDDYALNHSMYYLGATNGATNDATTALNKNALPDTFEVAEGEGNVTVNINEAHKLGLVYEGNADLSNFIVSLGGQGITNNGYFAVKNGEIVGLASTNGRRLPLTVSNGKGVSRTIWVTVSDTVNAITNPDFEFNVIKTSTDSLVKAKNGGSATVDAGKDIQLKVTPDPWYYPMDGVEISWEIRGNAANLLDDNGLVHTVRKGSAIVTANITAGGIDYRRTFTLNVADPFTISNMVLTEYNGGGDIVENSDGTFDYVVTIPSNKNIMTIGDEAFLDNKVITKVIIPKTVTQIDKRAFKGCTALKGVYFINENPDVTSSGFVADADLTLINSNAFEGCTALETVDLRNVKVITLGREVFKDCVKLKEILKSTAIGTAYDRAFMGCAALSGIDISGLHSAGANVFSGCTSLKTVDTARFTAIGAGMFTDLDYVYQEYNYSTNKWEDRLTEYPACTALQSVTVNSENIGARAFKNCSGLSSVILTDTVRNIGSEAFVGTSVTSISLPKDLISIGSDAFGSINLTTGSGNGYTVIVGDGVYSADGTTLLYYKGTGQSFTVPAEAVTGTAVTAIAEGAFANSNLTSVTIAATLTEIPAYAFYNTDISEITIPNTVTYIGDYAFASSTERGAKGSKLTKVNFDPAGKVTLGNYVFSGCNAVESITLHDNIIKLGNGTFAGCTSLRTVTLPSLVSTKSFTALGDYTFINTPKLQSVAFGADSNTTGNFTFYADDAKDRANFTGVTFGSFASSDGYRPFIGNYAFYNCSALVSIELKGATMVGEGSFAGCTALTTVTGLDRLTDIGAIAFAYCNSLKTLSLSSAVNIGAGAFMLNGSLAANQGYTQINMPNARTIGAMAFAGGRETTVLIPAGITEIGYGAFASSVNLTSFAVASGNEIYFEDNGVLYSRINSVMDGSRNASFALVAYPSAKPADIKDGRRVYEVLDETVKIAGSAFQGLAGGIDKVVLPYGLKVVGASAFYDSGITAYEFKGVTAPALETEYSAVIDSIMDGDSEYRGFYYSNFESEFLLYAGVINGNPARLTIYRPDNGTGYDNYIFANYFDVTELTGIARSEAVNSFVTLVTGFVPASEVSGWNSGNTTKEAVEAFAASVKEAHEHYNTFSDDETQLAFVDGALITKLTEIEAALRPVKAAFGIPVSITRLAYTGNYKSEYRVGERFDIRGLQIIIIYDDFSTENADMSKVTYESVPLTLLDNVVRLNYEGRVVRVGITVTENGGSSGGCGGGCGSTAIGGGTALMTLSIVGIMILAVSIVRRKKQR